MKYGRIAALVPGFITPALSSQAQLTRNAVWLLCVAAALASAPHGIAGDSGAAAPGPLTLWYDKPAELVNSANEARGTYKTVISQALPIGNGYIGALIKAGVPKEFLRVSDKTLWTGGDTHGGYDILGSFQALGDLAIDLRGQEPFSHYRRSLDLTNAVAQTSYTANGIDYQREYFCSYPDRVIAIRLTASKPGSYTGSISYRDAHEAISNIKANLITVASCLGDASDLKYETQILVLNDGGSQHVQRDEWGDSIEFDGCNSLTLLVAEDTNYAMNFATHYRQSPPHDRVSRQLMAAAAQPYDSLKARHIADYQRLFDRCSLDLGVSSPAQRALPMDLRHEAAVKATDPEFEDLMFQYARYLLIASSRPGSIAPNSQGLWNDSNVVVFGARYTHDLTSQMPFWPVETLNLSECHLPLFDFLESQIPAWKIETYRDDEFTLPSGAKPSRGFAIRGSGNIMGGLAFWWDKAAAAWYCHDYWEHYQFTQDRNFLATVAYPVMKEVCEFNDEQLKALPDGALVVPHCFSPEHGPWEDGVSYDQEIVWALFNDYVAACDVLGVDKAYRDRIAGLRDRLAKPGIGSWGQLLEWHTDKKGSNPNGDDNYEGINFRGFDTPADHHRHTSHLWAVYPGYQITPDGTPQLAAAARTSLIGRGDTHNEWNFAWRCAIYARLHDSKAAYGQLRGFFAFGIDPNLMSGGGPLIQFDGNSGLAAGMAEMLLQSQTGVIQALPALPREWPAGSVKGLRARGGFEVDESWSHGALTSLKIHSLAGLPAKIRYRDKTIDLHLQPGQTALLDTNLHMRL
jgi:alpha-L-fucosidase 2